ncbi:type IV pilin protein [Acinetobacter sp. V2]|uniref:type IV pilin protein n=1 Tax=Acinetobacter sp. V2 TaxID=1051623 RepID=UPI00061EC663|nr:type IV pilin protein [Acinetobacter sp. V2]KKC43726.1 competence protein ComE [Acinetobacter sp. V2]
MKKNMGFTLIELMIVVMIVAVFAAIAIPSYQAQIRRADTAAVQQELLKLAGQLERYKSQNFSYHGFDPKYLYGQTSAMSSVDFPSSTNKKYTITLADVSGTDATTLLASSAGLGQRWAIRAIPETAGYDALLVTSTGIKCKSKYLVANDLTNINNYTGCAANAKKW